MTNPRPKGRQPRDAGILVEVPRETRDRIKAAAAAEERSMASLIRFATLRHVERIERERGLVAL